MKNEIIIPDALVEALFKKLNKEAEDSGYHLNPDTNFTKKILKGILINEKRYGYGSCPCRLASGVKKEDLDIICPCDYRDDDLNQFGTCFCALYVSNDVIQGKKKVGPIPERRSKKEIRGKMKKLEGIKSNLKMPVWRCKVCGYLCARNEPPEVCPICMAEKERFERFM